IHGRQLVTELNGESCLPLKRRYQAPQSIANTRTFGEDTNDPNVLEAAMTSFIAKVTRQLRDSHQLTTKAGYFMATNRHRPGYIMKSELLSLPFPTADNGFLNQFIMGNVRRSFSYSQLYHRAGVWIQDFIPDKAFQASLFEPVKNDIIDASEQRMQAIDTLNSRYGKHAIHYAAEDLAKSWQPKRKNQMPRYTTRWEELPIVKTL
ncbi:DUF4113 domain-containing protein, partial [Candidatus Saccharibacteria bacterium]|nr:DUF4113 domain-containing protein [Candidatus Saccharibacteria bacterium]